MKVLEIQNLTKHYPAFTLDNVSFDVASGSIMGFIGRNGAQNKYSNNIEPKVSNTNEKRTAFLPPSFLFIPKD